MQTHQEFFGCRYPIVAVAMNQVSDINLAIAVAQAGGFPSVSLFNYFVAKGVMGWDLARSEFQRFQDAVGNCNFILSLDTTFIQSNAPKVIDLIREFKISHLEIITVEEHRRDPVVLAKINHWMTYLQSQDVKLILKVVSLFDDIENWCFWDSGLSHVDAFSIKGPKSAGRVMDTDLSLEQMIVWAQEHYPNIPIIAVGGVGNAHDVKQLLDLGVTAIGAGTLFAASQESPVSEVTKLKMIGAGNADLTKLNTDNLKQNALRLGKFDRPDTENNTMSLRAGIKTGNQGHVFAGHGINSITEILPVNIIIERLFGQTNN
jgi:NAD(P)H-dependent flavin oxidoreductase YrpB (nitropropane dioxygenase family)